MDKDKKIRKLFIYATVGLNRYLFEYREMDEQGNLIEEIAFNEDGSIYEKVVHTHTEDGKVMQSSYYLDDDIVTHSISFDYDNDGDIIREIISYADGSLSIKSIQRNAEKDEETFSVQDENGKIEGKEFIRYNAKHQPILEIKYDESGDKELERTLYEYNEDGKVILLHSRINNDQDFNRKFEYIKDADGNITKVLFKNDKDEIMGQEIRTYTPDKKITSLEEQNFYTNQYKKTNWQFDEKGNNSVIRQYNANGDMNIEILLTYNDQNQIIAEETRSPEMGVTLKEFEYEFY